MHTSPETEGLDGPAEGAGGLEAAEAAIYADYVKPSHSAVDPVVVQRVWELVTDHSLTPVRARQFRARSEVAHLSKLAPIRVWTGAVLVQSANSPGHLLLDEWCQLAAGASDADLNRARPNFLEVWPSLTSGASKSSDPTS